MTDNIFDRLAELLSSSGPVNWGLAGELGSSVAGDPGTVPPGADAYWAGLADTANRVLGEASAIDLTPPAVSAVDRRQWTTHTISGFDYLAEPLATKLGADDGAMFAPVVSIMLGLQIGSMAGSISHRALGSFDAALPPLNADRLYFIAPNITEFTDSLGLDGNQAHLWVAAHELVAHRLLGLAPLRDRFRSLIKTYIDGLELDSDALPLENLDAGFDPERLGQMMQDPSFLTGMFTGPHQEEDLADIQAFLAVVEGYVEHLLNQLDPKLMPELPRIREGVDRRRATPSQGEAFLQKMLGIELQRPTYRAGAEFFAEIERRFGSESATTVFSGGDAMPSLHELDDPVGWAARTLLS
ncbi:MAG: hypothetical protein HKN74_11130 [Acidimicrobiia bacterium]|nr:zinc-dependent metalloprotease [Acidimicrobiia bacterium]MBT8215261.1 zinc-dependent metalloprotease [Acidimicrobiia bacterium]NNF10827.1 hypothetical protein [Acidimicrobiia bacterium]NNL70652.1 hypothetical protein [Acidimicrobiia bacterium]